jgi:drug/metabolite transporter (DMT)-like permease
MDKTGIASPVQKVGGVPTRDLMPKPQTAAITVWLALFSAVALDTLAELLWKLAVKSGDANASWIETLSHCALQPFFILAMLLFIPKYFNWMYVLRHADLTYAKPITSLGYIGVLTVSALVLHESLTVHKVLGVALVLAGVLIVSRTEVHTAPGDEK